MRRAKLASYSWALSEGSTRQNLMYLNFFLQNVLTNSLWVLLITVRLIVIRLMIISSIKSKLRKKIIGQIGRANKILVKSQLTSCTPFFCRCFFPGRSFVPKTFTTWCVNAGNATLMIDLLSKRSTCFYYEKI